MLTNDFFCIIKILIFINLYLQGNFSRKNTYDIPKLLIIFKTN
jgi:hypothetical protein